jgi:hypothetical protein
MADGGLRWNSGILVRLPSSGLDATDDQWSSDLRNHTPLTAIFKKSIRADLWHASDRPMTKASKNVAARSTGKDSVLTCGQGVHEEMLLWQRRLDRPSFGCELRYINVAGGRIAVLCGEWDGSRDAAVLGRSNSGSTLPRGFCASIC